MPNRLLADLIFWHWRDDLVVHQQAIDEKRLFARRVRGLELHGLTALGILNASKQSRLEQLPFVFEFLQRRLLCWQSNRRGDIRRLRAA
jgi:hypothetical protein